MWYYWNIKKINLFIKLEIGSNIRQIVDNDSLESYFIYLINNNSGQNVHRYQY